MTYPTIINPIKMGNTEIYGNRKNISKRVYFFETDIRISKELDISEPLQITKRGKNITSIFNFIHIFNSIDNIPTLHIKVL